MNRNRAVRLIGVDVASQPKNVGLAMCTLSDDHLRLEEVKTHSTWPAIDAQLADWLIPAVSAPALLAIDAPLGWPAALAHALCTHRAGGPLPPAANSLFRRQTDDVVAKALGKRPLDVGADRIARTAHAALNLLGRLREIDGLCIPLAWRPGSLPATSVIEVYPAGTLAGRALPCARYKGASPEATGARRRIVDGVRCELAFSAEFARLLCSSDHLLDAAVCCIAAGDFVRGCVIEPDNPSLARREGWIWVASP